MTDVANRNRVQAGVPTGGQFATEARSENPDLTRGPSGLDDISLREDGMLEVNALSHIDPKWFEENRGISDKLRDAGVTGRMVVFAYSPSPLGEWKGSVQMPGGGYLVFSAHRGSQMIVETRSRVSDGAYESGANGLEGQAGAGLQDIVGRVVREHEMLNRLRDEMPFVDISCTGGSRDGQTRVRIRSLSAIGQDSVTEVFELSRPEDGRAPHWVPVSGPTQKAWDIANMAVGPGEHETLSVLCERIGRAAQAAEESANVQWHEDGILP